MISDKSTATPKCNRIWNGHAMMLIMSSMRSSHDHLRSLCVPHQTIRIRIHIRISQQQFVYSHKNRNKNTIKTQYYNSNGNTDFISENALNMWTKRRFKPMKTINKNRQLNWNLTWNRIDIKMTKQTNGRSKWVIIIDLVAVVSDFLKVGSRVSKILVQ